MEPSNKGCFEECGFEAIDSCLNCNESFCFLHGYHVEKTTPHRGHRISCLRFCSVMCHTSFYQTQLMKPDMQKICRRCRFAQTCLEQNLCFACIPAVFVLHKTKTFLKQLRSQYIAVMRRDFPQLLPLRDLNITIYAYIYGDFFAMVSTRPLPIYRHLIIKT